MTKQKRLPFLLNLFLLPIYLFAIVFLSIQLMSAINLKYNSNSTQGTVLGYDTRTSSAKFIWNRKPEHAPIVKFSTEKGKVIKVRSKGYEFEKKYKVGDTLNVFYNKIDPTGAYVEGGFTWPRDMLLLSIALLGTCYTVPPIVKRYRK